MSLLFKHLAKDFFSKKTMVTILSLILVFTSFMYFFVHFAIDENLRRLSVQSLSNHEVKYMVALKSNQILIRNITISMVGILSLILFLFMRGTLRKNQIKIAQFLSMGFSFGHIIRSYVLLIFSLSFVSSLLGFGLGFWGSSILISANAQTYLVNGLEKGLSVQSFVTGILWLSLFLGIITYLAGLTIGNKDIALMLKQTNLNMTRPGIIEKILQKLPVRRKFRFELTLSSFNSLGLLIVAIVTFSIMFVLSVSLILSSSKVIESQKDGRHFTYDISYKHYQNDDLKKSSAALPYLKYDTEMEYKNNKVNYHVVSLKGSSRLFQLFDHKGKQLNAAKGVFLNPELKENYGIKAGDSIDLKVKGKKYKVVVSGFAENADLKTIYVPEKQAQNMIKEKGKVFNGLLTNKIPSTDGKVTSFKKKIAAVKRSQTSNKVSAIINQSIGIITGCLLIYLAIFIGLNNNINNILVFDLLGYDRQEINKILLNPYIILSNILFLLTLPLGIYAAQYIQRMTSLQTGDYMPFQFSLLTFIYMLAIMNVLCLAIRFLFVLNVRKIIHNERQAEFLVEW
ncbi:FtsX-like permease family protein [Streptococcus macacae]|uniref:Efflux ABC transporter, permease protein n=1 Tax=Streptococcus macacae NCTC 11558 TaxID=764298 RepID=G5JVJ5_9STRE|nr:FtsX-like permease family protein [Streptococcus macacae]EHJ51617.1 efflux ABC transporter, permease protein [Streptococcus macacae NCTC 11558]SUN78589.1 permease [Streptococcus macacae NCTC 11558]